MPKKGKVSEAVYRTLLEHIPIPTTDFIVTRRSHGRREFLLAKRTEEPFRGQWFVPGGRIFKGERMIEAVRRNLHRELGIKEGKITFVGCLDAWNPPRMGIRWHSIWYLHTVELAPGVSFRLNGEHARVKWFTGVHPRWPKTVREALQLVGFR